MILTKQYLNECVQKKTIRDSKMTFSANEMLNENWYIKDGAPSFDVFISYSAYDKEYATAIYQLLKKAGLNSYIDLLDKTLNRAVVNRTTAERLAKIMDKCKALLYLHSKSATVSRWCPWELGYFSGKKNFRCAMIPLKEIDSDVFPKQEYLEIYPYVDYETSTQKAEKVFWVNDRDGKYVSLKGWLNGNQPYDHSN